MRFRKLKIWKSKGKERNMKIREMKFSSSLKKNTNKK